MPYPKSLLTQETRSYVGWSRSDLRAVEVILDHMYDANYVRSYLKEWKPFLFPMSLSDKMSFTISYRYLINTNQYISV